MNLPPENLIEALLFSQSELVPAAELRRLVAEALGRMPTEAEWTAWLEALRHRYAESSLELVEAAGGYGLRTRPAYGAWLCQVQNRPQPTPLSKPLLETLALVAYHQPVTRSYIQHLRGTPSDYAIERLLELELIEPAGRASLPGRPMLYRTTAKFLELLGLRSLADLPRPEAFLPQPAHIDPP
ncbi:MAG: SMC-Scp complex subunit ScpB [Bacteroidia bacterium]